MSYTHFTLEERKNLEKLLASPEKLSLRQIADAMGRSPSTISREIKRNRAKYKPHGKPKNPYWYNAWRAQNLYTRRRRACLKKAIQSNTDEWKYIVDKLSLFWPPETICATWNQKHPERKPIHFSTIYRYIANNSFPKIKKETHLRRKGKRSQTRNANYNSIQPDRIIPDWTDVIRSRARIGDWEGDTVYGGIGKGLLVTLVDRKSRYVRIGLLKNRQAKETRLVIEELLQDLPVNSISLDNGSEFSEFRALEQSLRTLVYFAEPHKPWQRGTNENTNDLIRFFFPKGFDFRTVTDADISYVENLLNDRPRKCLNWKTPREVFFEKSVALA